MSHVQLRPKRALANNQRLKVLPPKYVMPQRYGCFGYMDEGAGEAGFFTLWCRRSKSAGLDELFSPPLPPVRSPTPRTPTMSRRNPHKPHPHHINAVKRSLSCHTMSGAPRSLPTIKAASARRCSLPHSSSTSSFLLLLLLVAVLTTTTVEAFTRLPLPSSSRTSTCISSQPKLHLLAPKTFSAPPVTSSPSSVLYASFFAPKPSVTNKGKKEGKGVKQVRAYFEYWNQRRMDEAVACFSGRLE